MEYNFGLEDDLIKKYSGEGKYLMGSLVNVLHQKMKSHGINIP